MGRPPAAPAFPIQIVEVSEAAFNSFLHVKFTFTGPDGRDRAGLLVFVPRSNGGYEIHYGGTGTSEDSSKKIGSLAISRSTIGGSCEIVNHP